MKIPQQNLSRDIIKEMLSRSLYLSFSLRNIHIFWDIYECNKCLPMKNLKADNVYICTQHKCVYVDDLSIHTKTHCKVKVSTDSLIVPQYITELEAMIMQRETAS